MREKMVTLRIKRKMYIFMTRLDLRKKRSITKKKKIKKIKRKTYH